MFENQMMQMYDTPEIEMRTRLGERRVDLVPPHADATRGYWPGSPAGSGPWSGAPRLPPVGRPLPFTRVHVSNIIAKLGVSSRGQAAAWAHAHGVIV